MSPTFIFLLSFRCVALLYILFAIQQELILLHFQIKDFLSSTHSLHSSQLSLLTPYKG